MPPWLSMASHGFPVDHALDLVVREVLFGLPPMISDDQLLDACVAGAFAYREGMLVGSWMSSILDIPILSSMSLISLMAIVSIAFVASTRFCAGISASFVSLSLLRHG